MAYSVADNQSSKNIEKTSQITYTVTLAKRPKIAILTTSVQNLLISRYTRSLFKPFNAKGKCNMVLESIITATRVSFVCTTTTIKDCKSVESMTITVI